MLVAANDSYGFINGALKEGSAALKVSKTFMSYIHSDRSLNTFIEKTNMFRPFNTTVTDETKAKMSVYGKNLLKYRENTDIVYPYSSNSFMNGNYAVFKNTNQGWNWHSYSDTLGEMSAPLSSIRSLRDKGITADIYFNGLYTYYKDYAWKTLNLNA